MAKPTILLIDYDPKSIEKTRRPLENAGYRVETASDGIAGLEAFEKLQPSLVLIEAMIPKKHGFEVCQEIKKSARGKTTPVIITTAVYRGRKYKTQAKHIYGADDYLEKPVDDALLLETCQKFLPDGAGAEGPSEDAPAAAQPQAKAMAAAGGGARHGGLQADWTEEEIEARLSEILPGLGGGMPSGDPEPAAPMNESAQAAAAEETAEAAPAQDSPAAAEPPAPAGDAEPAHSTEGAPVVPFDPERRSRKKRDTEGDTKSQEADPDSQTQEDETGGRASSPASDLPGAEAEAEAVGDDEVSPPEREPEEHVPDEVSAAAPAVPDESTGATESLTEQEDEAASAPAGEPQPVGPWVDEDADRDPSDERESALGDDPEPAPVPAAGPSMAAPHPPAPVEEGVPQETPGESVVEAPATLPTATPTSSNRTVVWGAAAATTVLVVAVAAFFLMRGGDEGSLSPAPIPEGPVPERLAVSDEPDLSSLGNPSGVEGDGPSLQAPGQPGLPPLHGEAGEGDGTAGSETVAAPPEPAGAAAGPAPDDPGVTASPPVRSPAPRRQPEPSAEGRTGALPGPAAIPAATQSPPRLSPETQAPVTPKPAARRAEPPPSSPPRTEPPGTTTAPAPSAAGATAASDTPGSSALSSPPGEASPEPSDAASPHETAASPGPSPDAVPTASDPSTPSSPSAEPEPTGAIPPGPGRPAGTATPSETPASKPAPATEPKPSVRPGMLVNITEVDREPVPKRHDAPPYTLRARRLRQEGTVYLNVLVNEKGRVESVEIIKGIPGSDLNESAANTARRWTYEPAVKDGVPVKVWKVEKVVFDL